MESSRVAFFHFFLFHSALCMLDKAIYSAPSHLKVSVGSTVQFNCEVSHADQVTDYFWNKEKLISHNSNCYMSDNCGVGMRDGNVVFLEIRNVRLEDEGKFQCQVVWQSKVLALEHFLTVLEKPKIKDFEVTEFLLRQEEQLTMHCEATGVPEPTIIWSKTSSRQWNSHEEPDPYFSITNATRADEGKYVCTALNEAGKDEEYIDVNVLFKPEVSVVHKRVYCGVSYKCTMRCFFEGFNEVSVQWSHPATSAYGQPASWVTETRKRSPKDMDATLTLQQAKPEDIGVYTCTGSNDVGSAEETIELTFNPTTPNLTSLHRRNFYSDRYLLEWTLTSYSKLKLFEAVFHWIVNASTSVYLANMTIKARDNTHHQKYESLQMPIVSFNYIQSEMLSTLRRGSKYSVQMRAQNLFGHSAWSDVGYFRTAGSPRSSSSHISPSHLTTFILSFTLLFFTSH